MTVAHNSLRGREWNCLWAVGEKIQFQERVLHFFNLTLSLYPSPIGEGRITTSFWAKQKISFLRNFLKNQPSPSIPLPSEREELPHHSELSEKSLFSAIFKNRPSPSIPLPSEREKLPRHTEKSKKSVLSTVLKNPTLSLCPSPIGEGRITSSHWAKRRISNLSVRIEIPKQVRNDSCAQLSPRERVKLSLSRWRKDTISREGSSFFQSDPLPLSLSHRRGKNYLVILS